MQTITVDQCNKGIYIWQQYLAKQLLIPTIKSSNENKLYIISSHFIDRFSSIKIAKDKYTIEFITKTGQSYYYPESFKSLLEAFSVEKNLTLIMLGKICPSIADWLIYFSDYDNNYEYIES
jgi:hypothetical protein